MKHTEMTEAMRRCAVLCVNRLCVSQVRRKGRFPRLSAPPGCLWLLFRWMCRYCAKEASTGKEPNKTEREYWRMLQAQFPQAEIRWESYTLRMASRATYSPDFSILHADGVLDFHEVKGAYVFPKALAKLRIAAGLFSHKFTLAQKLKRGWQITELPQNPKP